MRNNLFSIGETAKMKNVSIKSLRYYERIGVFKPAYVDPDTGYRYYSPNQLMDLDVILSCIELGVPLKSLLEYLNEDNSIDMKALLETGQSIANQRIREAQNSLARIETYLDEVNIQETLRESESPYERTLPEWEVITSPWLQGKFNVHNYINTMSKLYAAAEESNACPLYFQGLLVHSSAQAGCNKQRTTNIRAYIRTAKIPTVPYSAPLQNESIPDRTYKGQRFEAPALDACFEACLAYIQQNPGDYLLTEVWDTELTENTYVVELLKAKPENPRQ